LLDQTIKVNKSKKNEKLPKPSIAQKVERPPPRPPTPTLEKEYQTTNSISINNPTYREEEDIEKLHAIIFLQKLLRGRAIQNMMYEGRMRRKELIEELKAASTYKEITLTEDEEDESKEQVAVVPQQPIIVIVNLLLYFCFLQFFSGKQLSKRKCCHQ
jgi:hypothetical protein